MRTVVASAAINRAGIPNRAGLRRTMRLIDVVRRSSESAPRSERSAWFRRAQSCDSLESRSKAVRGAQQVRLVRMLDRHFRHHTSAEEDDGPVAGEGDLG